MVIRRKDGSSAQCENRSQLRQVDRDRGAPFTIDPEFGFSGVAYCAPERMTHGTSNLLLIGVHSGRRRQGRGTRLLKQTEALLRERGDRTLIVKRHLQTASRIPGSFTLRMGTSKKRAFETSIRTDRTRLCSGNLSGRFDADFRAGEPLSHSLERGGSLPINVHISSND